MARHVLAYLELVTPVGIGQPDQARHNAFPVRFEIGKDVSSHFRWLASVIFDGKPLVMDDLGRFPDEAVAERAYCESEGISSYAFVPATIGGTVVAALVLDNYGAPQPFDELIVQRLQLVAAIIASADIRTDALREVHDLKQRLQDENLYLQREVRLSRAHGEIIGDSNAIRSVLQKAEQVAPTGSTVLILGETGTGKELMAHRVHQLSPRKDRTLIKVNCATLPSSLVEAELFGREKGAYTGSLNREPGRFEIADGSTILLDELGELSLELQTKLLRVLESGEFERLGSSTTIKVDVRILAATNRDLARAVEEKRFREDLFYRLNVFPIVMPPLREHIEDLPQLIWAFVQEFSETMGKTIESIPRQTMEQLRNYHWPGNVREVRNVIERAMIVTQGPTLAVDLPGNQAAVEPTQGRLLANVERDHIKAVVESAGWRISGKGGAAEVLGLKPTTLEARMKKLGIKRPKDG